ncbi:polysaccharide deacetylase family protein [Gorillibacterium sp. sgz5001074]|uniref:polysaccharide deacetylase n=1 Tax=Gorillibacterium sp. sgz5001074 TaxID=3446695 RepID=UPI003F66C648
MGKRWSGVRAGIRRSMAAMSAMMLLAGGGLADAAAAAKAPDGTAELLGKLVSGAKVEQDQGRGYREPERPTVYLTFDDGPSKLTGQVLDILKRERIAATFFVLGQYAEEHKELIRRMSEEGHAIGNHSYNHVYQELYRDFGGFWKQAVKTDGILESITGRKPFLLRAPGGTASNFDAVYFYQLEKAGYSVVDWNVDSRDAVRKGVKAEEILEEVRNSPLKHELTVLMHDGIGHEETVKALPGIIAYYREKGYDFAALDESVKPAQFRLSASKWGRTYTVERFEAMSKESELAAEERGTQWAEDRKSELRLARQGEEAMAESAEALKRAERGGAGATGGEGSASVPHEARVAAASVTGGAASPGGVAGLPPLRIGLGGSGSWTLSKAEYGFDSGRFTVPLRKLAEHLGASVSMAGGERKVSVRIGASVLEFDPVRRTILEQRPGQPMKVHHLADLTWTAEGEILVPLRVTAAMLGQPVAGYSLAGDEYKVELDVRERQGLYAWARLGDRHPAWAASFMDRLKPGFSQSHV